MAKNGLTWHTAQRKVSELHGYEYNPRKLTDEQEKQLKKSLKKFNLVEIPAIDLDNTIIAGHQRVKVLSDLGRHEELIDVRVPSRKLTEDEFKEYCLRSNKNTGEWDFDILNEQFDHEMLSDVGFLEEELISAQILEDGEIEEDEAPVVTETDIVAGDLFEIGKHRLLCGDSAIVDDVLRVKGDKVVNMVFTDHDFSMPFDKLKEVYGNELILNPEVSFWVCGDKQAVALANYGEDRFTHFFIHDFKCATLVPNNQPMQRHNLICKFGNKKINNLLDGFTTIIAVSTERLSQFHDETPMAKKVELPAVFLKHYANQGDIIFDFFAHSGSTMRACEQLSMRCFCIEIEPKYCDVIIRRMLLQDKNLKVTKNGEDVTSVFLAKINNE